jgi:hypothetical protein
MRSPGRLLAWVEPHGDVIVAAFVGSLATDRRPASRACASYEEAQRWAASEAKAVGLPVEWLNNNAQPRIELRSNGASGVTTAVRNRAAPVG